MAEVGAPLIVLSRTDCAPDQVVRKCDARARILAPHHIVGRVDDSVLVVVAGEADRLQDYAGAADDQIEQTGVGTAEHEAIVRDAAGREDRKLLAAGGREFAAAKIDERHVEHAVDRRAAGDRQPVVLATRCEAADFNGQRIGVGQRDAAFEADVGRAIAWCHAAVEMGRARAIELAGPRIHLIKRHVADDGHRGTRSARHRAVDRCIDQDKRTVIGQSRSYALRPVSDDPAST